MLHAGLDLSAFPGLDTMAWLKGETGAGWTGFYLGPAPSHPETDWMGERAALIEQGWGLAPIFVGQQLGGPGSHFVSAEQGNLDGDHAATLMAAAGFPEHSCCFLDLEDGPPFVEPRVSYVRYWAGALAQGGYSPGIYCSHLIAEAVLGLFESESVQAPRIWTYKVATTARHPVGPLPLPTPEPAGSGVSQASMWQHDQESLITTPHGTVMVDVSSSLMADPSAP